MSRADHVQFNVRSAFARARAHELAKLTGMTVTQIVEDALRAYVPPGGTEVPAGMIRRGPLLVVDMKGKKVSAAEADAILNAVRERDLLKVDALLDSNVLVAMLANGHEHHATSAALFDEGDWRFAVAAHSFAEAYSSLTRRGPTAPFAFSSEKAWAGLESVRAVTTLIGLTAPQTVDAIKNYAGQGGIGPRIYDRLIGEAAVAHGIPAIVTWNVKHMRGLFPDLKVETPRDWTP